MDDDVVWWYTIRFIISLPSYHIINKKFINYIQKYSTYLEKSPLEKAAKKDQLYAFKHNGFWQCMDTKRDKDNLEDILKTKKIKF